MCGLVKVFSCHFYILPRSFNLGMTDKFLSLNNIQGRVVVISNLGYSKVVAFDCGVTVSLKEL